MGSPLESWPEKEILFRKFKRTMVDVDRSDGRPRFFKVLRDFENSGLQPGWWWVGGDRRSGGNTYHHPLTGGKKFLHFLERPTIEPSQGKDFYFIFRSCEIF